jgi:hypothetical protein
VDKILAEMAFQPLPVLQPQWVALDVTAWHGTVNVTLYLRSLTALDSSLV